ncbi:MAG: hypothetical protein LBL60_00275 [Mycoplasmataceae bacterium]|jgi:hypothetical protein|nr:hypothetical protein [Mycoplasmataceae bacterium]
MNINYSIIENLYRQTKVLNEDELKILLSKLDNDTKAQLQAEIFNSLTQNTR